MYTYAIYGTRILLFKNLIVNSYYKITLIYIRANEVYYIGISTSLFKLYYFYTFDRTNGWLLT